MIYSLVCTYMYYIPKSNATFIKNVGTVLWLRHKQSKMYKVMIYNLSVYAC